MSRPAHRIHLPMREGVSPSCVALPHGPWERVLDFLAERLSAVSATEWQQRMHAGRVLGEDGQPLAPDTPFRPGSRVYYYRELGFEPVIPFEATIVYQDAHLLVADKPHFLPVVPSGRFVQQTLLVRLKAATGLATLSPIHRIDRETAGLVVFSVRPQDRGAYQALFRARAVDKLYEAIAPLRPELPLPAVRRSRIEPDTQFFRQREVAGEPNSETRLALIGPLPDHPSLGRYRLSPLSGKTHQLRVHMNALGRPIVGDQFYPEVRHGPGTAENYQAPLQLLACALQFTDPLTGQPRRFESQRQLLLKTNAAS